MFLISFLHLQQINDNIKKALDAVDPDIERCLTYIKKLSGLELTPVMLDENRDILYTLKRCQEYEGSQTIRTVAKKVSKGFN